MIEKAVNFDLSYSLDKHFLVCTQDGVGYFFECEKKMGFFMAA